MGKQGKQDHHYMPRFLLRPWCTGVPRKLWRCCRIKQTGKLHDKRVTPKGTGFVADLYRLQPSLVGVPDQTIGDEQAIEKSYSRMESAAAEIRQRLVQGLDPESFSPESRRDWAEFLATLEHRGPRGVRHAEASALEGRERYREEHRALHEDSEYADKIFASIDVEGVARNAARTAPYVMRAKLARELVGWRWGCVKSDADVLLTADYPLVHMLTDTGFCVASLLALSPRALFFAVARPLPSTVGADLVTYFNLKLIGQKPNFVYSVEKLKDGRAQLRTLAERKLEPVEEL